MPRTQTQGIKFFSFDVDFFSDPKIKILKARYGTDGVTIYLYCLCLIYREGYYIKVDNDFYFIISDELNLSSETVEQVMTFLLKRSMFNEQLFKSDAILTGTGIQDRWQKAVKTRAQKKPIIVSDYWLLGESETEPFIKCTHFADFSEKKAYSSKKNRDNSENYDNKEKKSKVEESNNSHHRLLRTRAESVVFEKWGRKPTEQELDALLNLAAMVEDSEEILSEALRISAEAEVKSVAYVRGIYKNLLKNNIRTIEEYWEHEAERDLKKEKRG